MVFCLLNFYIVSELYPQLLSDDQMVNIENTAFINIKSTNGTVNFQDESKNFTCKLSSFGNCFSSMSSGAIYVSCANFFVIRSCFGFCSAKSSCSAIFSNVNTESSITLNTFYSNGKLSNNRNLCPTETCYFNPSFFIFKRNNFTSNKVEKTGAIATILNTNTRNDKNVIIDQNHISQNEGLNLIQITGNLNSYQIAYLTAVSNPVVDQLILFKTDLSHKSSINFDSVFISGNSFSGDESNIVMAPESLTIEIKNFFSDCDAKHVLGYEYSSILPVPSSIPWTISYNYYVSNKCLDPPVTNTALIVGLSIGGVVVIGIVVSVIFFSLRRRKSDYQLWIEKTTEHPHSQMTIL